METDRLKQFCVVIETENLTQAAKLLGISHSGLSKSMSVLQSELKMRLFMPKGRGLEATTEGRNLYPRAKALLQEVRSLHSETRHVSATPVRIGAAEVFLPPIAKEMPSEPMRLLEKGPGEIELLIAANEVDYGITFLPQALAGVEHLPLGKMKMGVFAKPGRFKSVPFSDIPFVVPFSSSTAGSMLDPRERDGWPDLLMPRKRIFEVNLLSSALAFVSGGHCAIFIPEFIGRELKLEKLSTPEKTPKLNREVWLVKKAGQIETPKCKKLGAVIRKLLA